MFGLEGGYPPATSAARIARGPYRAPGRFDTASSIGAPTTATSAPRRSSGRRASGALQNVIDAPA